MDKLLRQIKESPIYHGDEESAPYTVDTSPWGGLTSVVSIVVKLDGDDISDDVLIGSNSSVGNVITLPAINGLTAGVHYRLEIKFINGDGIGPIVAWSELIGQE